MKHHTKKRPWNSAQGCFGPTVHVATGCREHFCLEESHPAFKSWLHCGSFEVHLLPRPPMLAGLEVVNMHV